MLLQDSLDVRQKESMKTVEMGSLEVKKQRLPVFSLHERR
jgi:hypothetical protein